MVQADFISTSAAAAAGPLLVLVLLLHPLYPQTFTYRIRTFWGKTDYSEVQEANQNRLHMNGFPNVWVTHIVAYFLDMKQAKMILTSCARFNSTTGASEIWGQDTKKQVGQYPEHTHHNGKYWLELQAPWILKCTFHRHCSMSVVSHCLS